MVLVDTSVWISHLRGSEAELQRLLLSSNVACHPFVIGELACGNLANRAEILELLGRLPRVTSTRDEEVLAFISTHRLMGRGIGLIDAHLLASATRDECALWTQDRRLLRIAVAMGVAYNPTGG